MSAPRLFCAAIFVALLAGCAAPSLRGEHEDRFKFRAAGAIPPDKVLAFLECVQDGLTAEQRYIHAMVYQTRRVNGYRIDLKTDKYILLSADVLEDGRTQLLEGPAAGMLPSGAEIGRYEECVKRFGKPLSESPIPRG
jgi:hypothetical protein